MQYRDGDTIVAAATPPGRGALAVVRVSGPGAISIAGRIFRGKRDPLSAPPRTALRGSVVDGSGAEIDDVLLVCFPGPRSYTAEDSVEISCHGGPYLVRRIVERIVAEGARPAGPGEFTRRAFRNGRIDLAQAESVADLIRARTEGAARSALGQLRGGLSRETDALRGGLVDLLSLVEADLDFSAEEEVPRYDREEALRRVRSTAAEIERLVRQGEKGRLLRDGVRVAIVGRPNSGKSTLFNAIVGEERAIVSPEPGTTRDLLEGETEIGGLLFQLSDTAGMREGAAGPVEEEGIRRAKRRVGEADLVLVVVDGSEPVNDEDRAVLESTAERKRIVVLAKGDLPKRSGPLPAQAGDPAAVSALTGEGIAALREALLAATGTGGADEFGDVVVTAVRHVEAFRVAAEALRRAEKVVGEGELLAEDLREAAARLGEITGAGTRDEILDRIFSRFCIGK